VAARPRILAGAVADGYVRGDRTTIGVENLGQGRW
jgi:hypothetical protein